MDLPDLIAYCLSLPNVEEATPFGPDVLVYKIQGKLFALTQPDEYPVRVNLKCDPARAEELRDQYPKSILPGYHMNKRHWNTLMLDGSLPPPLIRELIDHSYQLVSPKPKRGK
jgi:predicted DNA-binding protein (MmcQ/YjbR family)